MEDGDTILFGVLTQTLIDLELAIGAVASVVGEADSAVAFLLAEIELTLIMAQDLIEVAKMVLIDLDQVVQMACLLDLTLMAQMV